MDKHGLSTPNEDCWHSTYREFCKCDHALIPNFLGGAWEWGNKLCTICNHYLTVWMGSHYWNPTCQELQNWAVVLCWWSQQVPTSGKWSWHKDAMWCWDSAFFVSYFPSTQLVVNETWSESLILWTRTTLMTPVIVNAFSKCEYSISPITDRQNVPTLSSHVHVNTLLVKWWDHRNW